MYICNGTTWAPSTGDATAEPKVLMFTGTGWPDRPASSRPTLFVGGTSADAPTDADLRNGDMWISEEGLSLVAWEGITNKPDYIAAGDTDYEAREAIGAAAATDILPSGTAGRAVLEADTAADERALIFPRASTITASQTITLSISSAQTQVFTGTAIATVLLPTTAVIAGQAYTLINQSTGAVTVQSSGANTITVLTAGQSAICLALADTPTTAAHWRAI